LKEQGYTGSYASVWRAINRLVSDDTLIVVCQGKPLAIPLLSARRAAWLFSTRAEDLQPEQQYLRQALQDVCQGTVDVYALAQSFGEMIRNRDVDALDDWLRKAKQCVVAELQRFADSLQRDYDAVKAALQYAWSNGPVEGQVNRLKFIKRQMYGRAKFDLLRKRVLGYSSPA
jgi:transposase